MKYYKAEDVDYAIRMKYAEEDSEEREEVISEICRLLSDLPTIEVSEDCIYTYCSRCGMRVVVDAPSVVPK